jgi:hypothetical protein
MAPASLRVGTIRTTGRRAQAISMHPLACKLMRALNDQPSERQRARCRCRRTAAETPHPHHSSTRLRRSRHAKAKAHARGQRQLGRARAIDEQIDEVFERPAPVQARSAKSKHQDAAQVQVTSRFRMIRVRNLRGMHGFDDAACRREYASPRCLAQRPARKPSAPADSSSTFAARRAAAPRPRSRWHRCRAAIARSVQPAQPPPPPNRRAPNPCRTADTCSRFRNTAREHAVRRGPAKGSNAPDSSGAVHHEPGLLFTDLVGLVQEPHACRWRENRRRCSRDRRTPRAACAAIAASISVRLPPAAVHEENCGRLRICCRVSKYTSGCSRMRSRLQNIAQQVRLDQGVGGHARGGQQESGVQRMKSQHGGIHRFLCGNLGPAEA